MTAQQLQKKYKSLKQSQKIYESNCLELTSKINYCKKLLNKNFINQDFSFISNQIDEHEKELNNLQQVLNDLIANKNEIKEFIYSISDDSIRSLMIEYVIKQSTWETTARRCHLSSSRAKHICNDFLKSQHAIAHF